MSVALRGSLEDFGIAEVFQLIGQQQKTGLLDISADSKTMRLAFDEGRVVWASPAANTEDAVIGDQLVRSGLLTQEKLGELQRESEASARSVGVLAASAGLLSEIDLESVRELVTQETIFEVLRWTGGSFHFSAQAVVHDRPPEKLLAAEQILMDGLRMVDEWQTFAGLVPSRDTVFQRKGQIESYREQVSGDAAHRLPYAERVFALVDGRLSAGRIIDLSRLGLFEGTRALAELHRASLIAPLAGRLARSRARAGRAPRRRVAEKARPWLAAAFPLALLSLMVSLTLHQRGGGAQPTTHAFAIVRQPLEEARHVFEKRRVRYALEAHRLLRGRFPTSLDELSRTGLLGEDALTQKEVAPYYYARRDGGVLLLAPER